MGNSDQTGRMRDEGERGVEERIRRRIAEALRRDGASSWKIGQEILLLLPDTFVKGYEQLFHKALDTADAGSRTMGSGKKKVNSPGNSAGIMAVSSGGRKYRTYGVVRDEEALAMKGLVDRRLRRLARDIDEFLRGQRQAETGRRCPGCELFVEQEWTFCASCGSRL